MEKNYYWIKLVFTQVLISLKMLKLTFLKLISAFYQHFALLLIVYKGKRFFFLFVKVGTSCIITQLDSTGLY